MFRVIANNPDKKLTLSQANEEIALAFRGINDCLEVVEDLCKLGEFAKAQVFMARASEFMMEARILLERGAI